MLSRKQFSLEELSVLREDKLITQILLIYCLQVVSFTNIGLLTHFGVSYTIL